MMFYFFTDEVSVQEVSTAAVPHCNRDMSTTTSNETTVDGHNEFKGVWLICCVSIIIKKNNIESSSKA
jgi:hypothetical protein